MATREQEHLLAHVTDLLGRAERGELTYTAFLTPAEQHFLARELSFAHDKWLFDGGFAEAERRRMILLPDYVAAAPELLDDMLAPLRAECLVALSVRGSGYRTLTHRDFLGAVLNLGIVREALGDLCVLSSHECVLFCDALMADFLCRELCRVANDAVSVSPVTLPADFDGGRKFETISDTVPSARADAVVAALCRLSRERAQALFRTGSVEIDYELSEKPDTRLSENCVIVVRGYGKFRVRSLSDLTKKGRYRLLAERYI